VFATTEPQKIAQAAAPVLSRLQRFDLKRIGNSDIVARLQSVLREEKIEWEPEALAMIARAADGSMRDALSLTDQVTSLGDGGVTAEHVRVALGLVPEDEYLRVIDMIAERKAADAFETVRRLADAGVDFTVFLSGLSDMLRAQLTLVLGGTPEGVSPAVRRSLESYRERFSASDLLRMLSTLAELEPQFRRSAQQQLLVEILLVRFALFDRAVTLEEVLRGLGPDKGSGGAAERQTPPRPRTIERETRRAAPTVGDAGVSFSPPAPPPPAPPTAPPSLEDGPDWKLGYEQMANDSGRSRFTTEAVRAERLAALRARDPVLDAAIEALDLELLD